MPESKNKTNRRGCIILMILILLQLTRLIYVFTVEKTGVHSDEIWGYGLANSYYKPHIFMTNDEETETYADKWVSGEVFKDYITVDEEDRFAYDSVLSNMKIDSHPPLYYLILHTISSIFMGEYSLWYGFSINLVCFVVLQIFLYKLMKFLTKSDAWALMMVAFYGFSVGTLDAFIFVRQYGMVTMFAVMTMYYHAKLLYSQKKEEFRNNLIKLAVAVMGGSLTHYYFIVFVFIMAACFFFYYLLKRKNGRLLAYSLVMMGAVLVTFTMSGALSVIGLGPELDWDGGGEAVTTGITTLTAGGIGTLFSFVSGVVNILYHPFFDTSFNIVVRCILYDIFGLDFYPNLPYWFIHACFIGALFLVIFVLGAVFVAAKSKDTEGKLNILSKRLVNRIKSISDYKFLLFSFALAVFFEHYVVMGFSKPWIMNYNTNRYLFLTYPVIMLLTLLTVKKLVSVVVARISARRSAKFDLSQPAVEETEKTHKAVPVVTGIIVLTILICNNIFTECVYLFQRNDNSPSLEEVVEGKDVVLALSDHWLMTCYCDVLSEAEDVFVTKYFSLVDYVEEIGEADTAETILIIDVDKIEEVVMLKNKCSREEIELGMLEESYMDLCEEAFRGKDFDFLMEDTIFMRNIVVYRVY